jgi:Tol biopolymer transport system component
VRPPTPKPSPTSKPVQPAASPTSELLPLRGTIAYSIHGKGSEEASVYVTKLDTGTTTRLGYGGCPSLSHDGAKVVYSSFESQPQTTVLLDLMSGQRWQLEQESVGGFYCYSRPGSISWDNNRVALNGVYVWERDNQRFLIQGSSPTWSPDDGWIAYELRSRIYKVPSSGGSPIDLAESTWTSAPSWSIKNEIVFGKAEDIYVMNADGSAQRRLTDHPGQDRYPVWSPDGTLILFYSDRTPQGWYVMKADGSNQTHLPNWTQYAGISWSE